MGNLGGRYCVEFSTQTFNFCSFQVERVEELVSSGSPDISYMDNDKRSPLHAAAFVGNCDIVEILIEQVHNIESDFFVKYGYI